MQKRGRTRAVVFAATAAIALCIAIVWPVEVAAQSGAETSAAKASPHRAVPDFSGYWTRMNPLPSTFLLPLDDRPGPVWDPQDHDNTALPWLGDFTNPILRPHAAAAVQARNAFLESGGEELPPHSLCWPSGVPQALNLREPVQFLQAGDQITVLYQRDHQVRRIHLNVPHTEDPKPSWYGESIGHYEGANTLVVDTIGQHDRTKVDKFATPHTEDMHVVERYVLEPDGESMTVEFSVEDPETFTTAWYGRATYGRARGPITEIICAENNKNASTGLDYEIPVAAKADY